MLQKPTDQENESKAHYAQTTECCTELGNEFCSLLTCCMYSLTISQRNPSVVGALNAYFSDAICPCLFHLSINSSAFKRQVSHLIATSVGRFWK